MLIAGFYAGLCALLMLVLAARVMWLRNTHKVGLGTGGVEVLARAIRVHANAAEYVPLALLLLALLAFEQTRPLWLHVFGITLVVARVLHAIGLSGYAGLSFGRATGAGLTLLVTLAMAVLLIVRFVVMQTHAAF